MDGPWFVVGLGNPGDRYARTRHNVGAMAVERLAERFGVKLKKARFLAALAAEAKHEDIQLVLVRPTTFMNESGPPVASFAKRRDVAVARVVVCHDEIDLPFGALRVKRGGSTAGHHGLDSLVRAFRSPDFHRVRIGVGRPPSRDRGVDHVLQAFPKRQQEDLGVLIEEAGDAALTLVTDGLAATQERFNRGAAPER